MAEVLHTLMDSTDHMVEGWAPQKLGFIVSGSIRDERGGALTRSVSQDCDGQR